VHARASAGRPHGHRDRPEREISEEELDRVYASYVSSAQRGELRPFASALFHKRSILVRTIEPLLQEHEVRLVVQLLADRGH
jgi:hypothetical protein